MKMLFQTSQNTTRGPIISLDILSKKTKAPFIGAFG